MGHHCKLSHCRTSSCKVFFYQTQLIAAGGAALPGQRGPSADPKSLQMRLHELSPHFPARRGTPPSPQQADCAGAAPRLSALQMRRDAGERARLCLGSAVCGMKARAAARLENIVLPLASSGLTVYRLGNSWQHKQVELWPSQKMQGGMREQQHLVGCPSGRGALLRLGGSGQPLSCCISPGDGRASRD